LTTLDLRVNSIGDKGAKALAEALKENSVLTTLRLGELPRPPAYQQQHPPPPNFHQKPQPQGTRPQPTQESQAPSVPANEKNVVTLEENILKTWALQPPTYQKYRPIHDLLATVQTTFPPAFGVEQHTYFSTWEPISRDALLSDQAAWKKGKNPM
jgi:hypothetical protein